MSELGIDPAAVRGIAAALATSSGVIEECGRALGDTAFGSGSAGRDYGDYGAAVQAGLARIGSVLTASARTGAAEAAALRATADRYVGSDDAAADTIGRIL